MVLWLTLSNTLVGKNWAYQVKSIAPSRERNGHAFCGVNFNNPAIKAKYVVEVDDLAKRMKTF